MNSKIFIFLVLISLLFTGFGGQVAQAAGELADSQITIYVVPPITDVKILPTSSISSNYTSEEISITASPGEYEPASFVIRALDEITALEVEVTELTAGSNSIASNYVDIQLVKCWYQAGVGTWDTNNKLLTPELLLKDDLLVKVENEENYLKLTTGEYVWISERDTTPTSHFVSIEDLPVKDSSTLQPVNITNGTNKQFWVTVKVPDAAAPGLYTGEIQLRTPAGPVGELQLKVRVLPIHLAEPYLTYSLYYFGHLDTSGSIGHAHKTETQLREELEDMLSHGVTNPTVSTYETQLANHLAIRSAMGMSNQPLYYTEVAGDSTSPDELEALRNRVIETVELAQSHGVTEVYFYGIDEAIGEDQLESQRSAWQVVHEAGGRIYASGYTAAQHPPGNFEVVGDIQDLFICAGDPSDTEAAKWHSVGHEIFCYANPQVGEENPETYRRNFGLLLWQRDYDGAMNFAYQWFRHNPWNDFDHEEWRDHTFTYPTIDGVIDTIQWEGWREGVDDIRYLTTLLETIEKVKGYKDTSAAEAYLASLKSADLAGMDLDEVRMDIIDHILSLQDEPQNQPPVLNSIGNKSFNIGEPLTFTISATDPDGDSLTYSASNLPQGASFDPNTQTFSWAPNEIGFYADVHFEVSDGQLTDSEDITITVGLIEMTAIGNYPASPPVGSGGAPSPNQPELHLYNLFITPGEVYIGEEIAISVLVTNTGDAAGSCLVTLEINGVAEATKEIAVNAGATEVVSFTIIKNNAGTYVVEVNGLITSFIVKEAPTTIVEEAPATEISVFSVTPSYDTETHRLAFARVIYEVNNLHQPATDVELTLKVSLDGEPVEDLSLIPSSWLNSDRITDSRDYIPPQGWRSGTYTFQAELSVGGELYATNMEELEVTAESATPTFSWATLGEIIGATLILIAATISAILLCRRHLLRRLGKR